jgi:hypothetical protein
MNRLTQSSGVVLTSDVVECNCLDDCLIDHDNA